MPDIANQELPSLARSSLSLPAEDDGEAWLFKKAPGRGVYLSFMGHSVMENRFAPQGAPIGATVSWYPVKSARQQVRPSAMRHCVRSAFSVVRTRKPLVPTRAMTCWISWLTYPSAASRPIWHRTVVEAVEPRSVAGRRGIRATPNHSKPGRDPSRYLAGLNS